jgi:hypothetical protein
MSGQNAWLGLDEGAKRKSAMCLQCIQYTLEMRPARNQRRMRIFRQILHDGGDFRTLPCS